MKEMINAMDLVVRRFYEPIFCIQENPAKSCDKAREVKIKRNIISTIFPTTLQLAQVVPHTFSTGWERLLFVH
jgi:hypothetical protein